MIKKQICEYIVKYDGCTSDVVPSPIGCSGMETGINEGTPCPFDGKNISACETFAVEQAKQWLKNTDKSPLEIKPKAIGKRKRIIDLLDAMERYSRAYKIIPIEWINEIQTYMRG